MDHADHVRLLREGVPKTDQPSVWTDLGAGEGAFTLALADLVAGGSTIHAVDRDRGALDELKERFARLLPRTGKSVTLVTHVADFTKDLALPAVDGVVMANSLHFTRAKTTVVERVRGMLRPGGTLLLVEYDTDRGNQWVPYPFSFETWRGMAAEAGFAEPRLLATHPSRFLGGIYAAACARPR